jgi:hypothetical protein
MKTVTVTAELTPQQALDLAQLLKRIGFTEVQSNAVSNEEAYRMIDAIEVVRKALAEAGYAPR